MIKLSVVHDENMFSSPSVTVLSDGVHTVQISLIITVSCELIMMLLLFSVSWEFFLWGLGMI